MSFKKIEPNLTFANIALFNSRERNRAIKRMKEINAAVDWKPIEEILLRNYPVGKSFEGNEAYPHSRMNLPVADSAAMMKICLLKKIGSIPSVTEICRCANLSKNASWFQ